MIRNYAQSPDIISGYDLDDTFSIVVPVARTNLIVNPSFETNTTGWSGTAGGETLTRTTTEQYHGAYSLQITPVASTTSGVANTAFSLTSGTLYAISCKFKGVSGYPFRLIVTDSGGGTILANYQFTATGRWQWIWLYYLESSSTTRRVAIQKNGSASLLPFYIDGVQCEALANATETVSTYIDGDQQGLVPNQSPPAFIWTGTPHASSSSRSGLTRAGGMVVKLKDYSFFLTAIIGLGLAIPQNVRTEYARLDGAFDDYTRKPTRQFTLTGTFQGRSYQELRNNRSQIERLLDRDLVGLDQRMMLLHHIEGPCGDIQTNESRVLCKYVGGLGGNTNNHVAETVPITFEQYLPFVVSDKEQGSALNVRLTITNANAILKRSPAGVWSALSTGLAGGTSARTILPLLDGRVLVGGSFTSAGASGADFAALYTPSTDSFSNLAGSDVSVTGAVLDAALTPGGDAILAGVFTNVGSASGDFIVQYNVSANTFTNLGTGANGTVLATTVAPNGRIYAGADSAVDFGGVANTNGIGYYESGAWNAMSTGLDNGEVHDILVDGSRVYVVGSFTGISGVANTSRVAYWNTANNTWNAITTTAPSALLDSVVKGANGIFYFGGAALTFGGVTSNYHAKWNGVAFSPIQGATTLGGWTELFTQIIDRANILHIGGGNGLTVNGVAFPDSMARIIGSSYLPEDVDMPSTPVIYSLALAADGTLYVGFDTTGSAIAAGVTSVTNVGTARTYPTLTIYGPSSGTSRIYQLINYTTGRSIYLNLTIATGDVATFVFRPDNLSFTSITQGDIANTILPGSNEADFFLQPGVNIISFYSVDSTVTATLQWRPAFAALDDVT